MTTLTKIEWATHTFNPWEGCQKAGPGCDHCYAEARNTRFGGGVAINWGPGAPRRRTSAANWAQPLKWERDHAAFFAKHGHRQRVFCASLADVFDNAVDPEWRQDLFELIEATPNLDWLLLTKRIGNAARMIEGTTFPKHRAWPWPNVWLGATIVNQEDADRDIPKLLATPAAKRFLSVEPMLGPVVLPKLCDAGSVPGPGGAGGVMCVICDGTQHHGCLGIDWVICGGESGHNARPMHPDWARSLRDQCEAACVPFLFKQWGEWWEVDSEARDHEGNHIVLDPQDCEKFEGYTPRTDCVITLDGQIFPHPDQLPNDVPGRWMTRLGKKAAGRLLDGVEHNGLPA